MHALTVMFSTEDKQCILREDKVMHYTTAAEFSMRKLKFRQFLSPMKKYETNLITKPEEIEEFMRCVGIDASGDKKGAKTSYSEDLKAEDIKAIATVAVTFKGDPIVMQLYILCSEENIKDKLLYNFKLNKIKTEFKSVHMGTK